MAWPWWPVLDDCNSVGSGKNVLHNLIIIAGQHCFSIFCCGNPHIPPTKYLYIFFNSHKTHIFLFQITGLSLIITGCVIQGVYSNYLDFLGDSFFNTPVLLVVVGCIIFFVTFFGCCGAIKEHHCMTLAFSVFLSLILIIELGAGIASYAFRNQVIWVISSSFIILHNLKYS